MPSPIRRPRRPDRRGVTLVEMLVVVALVVLMMVILVQIFQSATGAMSASRTSTELDLVLRQIDGIIRSDLGGVTAKMTPPNDPKDKSGYFEYGENIGADAQGEDTDDYMAFTTKAPEGQSFTGRQVLAGSSPQPTTISSQVAEILYFLRNGNLYRRVLLVAPERQKSVVVGGLANGGFATGKPPISLLFGLDPTTGIGPYVSWQGLNDLSARPSGLPSSSAASLIPILNDLGDLTNRENRIFRPRFLNDYSNGAAGPADGIPDDFNGDGVDDYYPTLYYDGSGHPKQVTGNNGWRPNLAVNDGVAFGTSQRVSSGANLYDVYAFPYIFPEMYSVADPKVGGALGSLHGIYPNAYLNHAPLSIGDNLPVPTGKQSWWGFPTWRETMAGVSGGGGVGWTDPIYFVSKGAPYQQPFGLQTLSSATANLLPPLSTAGMSATPEFSDNVGSTNFIAIPPTASVPQAPLRVWEDDLILTNVRSFDIKAYDLNAGLYNTPTNGYFSAGYQDLGYGANPYIPDTANAGKFLTGSYVGGPNGNSYNATQPLVPWQTINGEPVGFGHEGRIPPLPSDYRFHPRRGINIGDPATAINRLNRVFDTWSTDYTNAPDTDLFLTNVGVGTAPIYPSFPPPYPSPLRGIQIQIRVVDPRGERSKVLTIRHDFTDKLTD